MYKRQICGKEEDILSSNMKILYDEDRGYYLDKCCSCHEVSPFEAKTMDILDQLGITYIREKSFDGLVGDSGRGLSLIHIYRPVLRKADECV